LNQKNKQKRKGEDQFSKRNWSWTIKPIYFKQISPTLPKTRGKLLFSQQNHTLPTELTKVSLHDLSHVRYFQRELTHAAGFYCFSTKLISQYSKSHFISLSTSKKPKSSGSKFLHSSSTKY